MEAQSGGQLVVEEIRGSSIYVRRTDSGMRMGERCQKHPQRDV